MKKIEVEKPKILWEDRKRTFLGLPWSFTKYTLTAERLFIKKGFLNVKEDEVRLYRILDVSLNRSLGQRIFGVGTIHCCSSDKSLGEFDIQSVKDSKTVKEKLSELIEAERVNKHVTNREYMTHDGFDEDPDHDFDYDLDDHEH